MKLDSKPGRIFYPNFKEGVPLPRIFSRPDPPPAPLNSLPMQPEPVQAPPPPEEPTFISGGLKLTDRQVDKVITRIRRRIEEVRDEMGIDIGGTHRTDGRRGEGRR